MDRLWAPWRAKYIESFSAENNESKKECLFCEKIKQNDDEKNLILYRGKYCYIIMNLFPYNSGHIMVVPYKHTPNFSDLEDEEMLEVMKIIKKGISALELALKPHGFNVGANLGRVSGAGIADHIHFHIVPRWNGDTNFMPVISETKIISELITDTYKKLKDALSKISD
ncbi:MAG: HIT domain-containing protein [Candidatus Kryptonium sp.]